MTRACAVCRRRFRPRGPQKTCGTVCRKEYWRRYMRRYQPQWRDRNLAAIRAKRREWYRRNAKKASAKANQWAKDHRDTVNAAARLRRRRDPERARQRGRDYRQQHRDRVLELSWLSKLRSKFGGRLPDRTTLDLLRTLRYFRSRTYGMALYRVAPLKVLDGKYYDEADT